MEMRTILCISADYIYLFLGLFLNALADDFWPCLSSTAWASLHDAKWLMTAQSQEITRPLNAWTLDALKRL